jgi:hypothetical protein
MREVLKREGIMERKRRKFKVDRQESPELFEQAYSEWKKWSRFHSHLPPARHALQGAVLGNASLEKEVSRAFGIFDNAIMILVSHDKTALGDPRVLERIKQAQWLGDRDFFEDLAVAVKSNVGIGRRMATDPAVEVIYDCAVRYLHGDRKCIREEYRHWVGMEFEQRRQERPKDKKYQSMIDHWEKTKESIAGEHGGLENFRRRVKHMANQIKKSSMPIPVPI